MSIKQKPEERLREYLSRFNALEVKNLDQSVALAAISNGLKGGPFSFSLYKKPPSTLAELLGFTGEAVEPEGMITLPVTAGEAPRQT
jgi:hypothetical protein